MAPDWDGPTVELWPAFGDRTPSTVERGELELDRAVRDVERALMANYSETATADLAGKTLHESAATRRALAGTAAFALTRLARMRCTPEQLCRLIIHTLNAVEPCDQRDGTACVSCIARAVTAELVACGAVYALGDWHVPGPDEDTWQGVPTDVVDRWRS